MFGGGGVKRSDGRRNSSQSGNETDRGLPTVSPSVERGAAAVAVEAVGGGGLHRRTSQLGRRNSSEPRERFPPFVFPLPPLSGFIAHSQSKHKTNTISKKVGAARHFFFFLFFFSLSLFFFYLFFFFYITFLFFSLFIFSVSLFLFSFFFFLSSHFCNRSGGGRGLAFPPLSPLCFPSCRLFVLSIIKRLGRKKNINKRDKKRAKV